MVAVWYWLRCIAAIGIGCLAALMLAASIFEPIPGEHKTPVLIVIWILVGAAAVAAWAIWPGRRPGQMPAPVAVVAASKAQPAEIMKIGGVAVDAGAVVSLTDKLAIVIDDGVIGNDEQNRIDALVAQLGLEKEEQNTVLFTIIGGMIEDAAADGEIDAEEETWIRTALVVLRIELTGPLGNLFEIACATCKDAAGRTKASSGSFQWSSDR